MFKTSLIDKMSTRIADYVMKIKGLDEDQYEVIKYGWYVLVANSLKLVIIFAAAQLLGIFQYMVCAVLAFALIRTYAGGIHSDSWLGCLLINSAIFFGSIYGAFALQQINPIYFIAAIVPVCFVVLYKYSPVDHHNKPLSKSQKKNFRKLSFITFAVLVPLSFVTPAIYSYIIIFSILAVCIMMLPITYRIANNKYGDKYFSVENI